MKAASVIIGAGAWAITLAWSSSIAGGFVLPKIIIACLVIIAVACALQMSGGGEAPARLDVATMVVVLVATASALASEDRYLSAAGQEGKWAYGLAPVMLYLYLIIASAAAPAPASWLGLLGGLLGALAWGQWVGLDPFVSAAALPDGRAIGTIGSPPGLGMMLSMLYFFGNPVERVVMLLGMWASGSRGVILALAAGTAAELLPKKARWIMLCTALLWPLAATGIQKDVARVEIWKTAAKLFAQNPLLGSGPDTFEIGFRRERTPAYNAAVGNTITKAESAHNDLLQVAATTGILGLAAYIFLLVSLTPHPALVALFAGAKFGVVPFSVLAVAAIIAGSTAKREPGPSFGIGLSGMGIMVLAVFIGRTAKADPCSVSQATRAFEERAPGYIKTAEKAAQCRPLNAQARLVYAAALLSRESSEAAVYEADAALALDPTYEPARQLRRMIK